MKGAECLAAKRRFAQGQCGPAGRPKLRRKHAPFRKILSQEIFCYVSLPILYLLLSFVLVAISKPVAFPSNQGSMISDMDVFGFPGAENLRLIVRV